MSCVVALAEDIVTLKSDLSSGASTRIRGEVIDFTGQELRLRIASGRERVIPGDQVERIDTTRTPEQTRGNELFEAGEFRSAAEQYRTALEAGYEGRNWVRREIVAQLIWCHRNLDEWDQAGDYFLALLASDPQTPDFQAIPILWTNEPAGPSVETKAKLWLGDTQNSAAMLMGASHLLASDVRVQALDRLRQLLRDADGRIAWLAFAQLWRAGSNNATPSQQRSFLARIESSDMTLRAGAYFVVGEAMAKEDPEHAAIALMRLPTMYPLEYKLSAAALLTTGDCLERLDRGSQARVLYREIESRFGLSPKVVEAKARLQRLASDTSVGDN